MDRIQQEDKHQYNLVPTGETEEPGSNLTFDQFIKLRDVLVLSNKYYASSAGRSLIIWTKLDGNPTWTIEIWEPNIMNMYVQPNGNLDWSQSTWKYVTWWWHPWYIACDIVKKGRYRLQHKEQFNNIDSSITRIHSYILQHQPDGTEISRAVFDWEWNTPWEILRITAFGYLECDLNKGDRLELKIEDQDWNDISDQIARDSNWRMVEYIDLAYNI